MTVRIIKDSKYPIPIYWRIVMWLRTFLTYLLSKLPGPNPDSFRRTWLPIMGGDDVFYEGEFVFEVRTQSLFRPDALVLFGTDETTRVLSIKCEGVEQLGLLTPKGVPGCIFDPRGSPRGLDGDAFGELKTLEELRASGSLRFSKNLPIRFDTLSVGSTFELRVSGRLTEAALWGATI